MAERKTKQTGASVDDFLSTVKSARRREDALVVIDLMQAASGEPAMMWGPSIIGFGRHEYQHADGKDVDICRIGFSPRATALTFYLGRFEGRGELLEKLGKHRLSGGGCLYINKLADIDLAVLKAMIERSWTAKAAQSGNSGC